jgi:hypothetical protein
VTKITLSDASVKITGPVTLAAGTTVDLASGTSVSISSGTVDLGSGSTVKIETAVIVSGASVTGQNAPTFAGRTASAQSTAQGYAGGPTTYSTIIPAPASFQYLELHGVHITAGTTGIAKLSSTPAATGLFAELPATTFDFQGATLPAGRGVYAAGGTANHVQLNYTIRT